MVTGIPYKKSKNGIVLSVRVRPGAKGLGIEGVEGDTLRVRLTAAPERGKANEQLVALLSKEFRVPKSSIRVVRGASSRTKLVEVKGVDGVCP